MPWIGPASPVVGYFGTRVSWKCQMEKLQQMSMFIKSKVRVSIWLLHELINAFLKFCAAVLESKPVIVG